MYDLFIGLLPVTLTQFEGYATPDEVALYWTTATEKNNEGFEVQRSEDAATWRTFGFVQGNGTTNSPQHYQYQDSQPLQALAYYRLKQIDYDGQYEYSPTIAIQSKANPVSIAVFPSPSKGKVEIKVANPQQDKLSIKVMSSTGNLVWESDLVTDSRYNQVLHLKNTGLYIVHVQVGD